MGHKQNKTIRQGLMMQKNEIFAWSILHILKYRGKFVKKLKLIKSFRQIGE